MQKQRSPGQAGGPSGPAPKKNWRAAGAVLRSRNTLANLDDVIQKTNEPTSQPKTKRTVMRLCDICKEPSCPLSEEIEIED